MSALAHYEATLSRLEPLTAEEERSLAARWQSGNSTAGAALIEANLPSVLRIARKYRRWGIPLDDIIQQGNIGLLRAASRFDPDQHCRLITYASYWIRAEIREYVVRSYRIVRLGTTKSERRAVRTYRTQSVETPAALARVSGMPLKRAERLWPLLRSVDASLDVSFDGGPTALERLGSGLPNPEESVVTRTESTRVRREVERALGTLPERERAIIEARWLSDSRPTLADLGRVLGVSKERVRQLEARAYERLRVELADFAA